MDGWIQRNQWVEALTKISEPVLTALSQEKLKKCLPDQGSPGRRAFAPLSAFGRVMCGIAPWLEIEEKGLGEEERSIRSRFRRLAQIGLDKATDPKSEDFMTPGKGEPPQLVDTAFLAHAMIRAPRCLIESMDDRVKRNVAEALKASRSIVPGPTNWILFSAMVETALYRLGADDYDKVRILYAVRTFQDWYKGDGIYGDGAVFHWDYYNSFVIQPMYMDILKTLAPVMDEAAHLLPTVKRRAVRYASILERCIGPDGTYPVIGRSICYRFGAFQLLSQAALEHVLEDAVKPEQVRCALTAVIEKTMSSPTMFDKNGWLRPGVMGYQPDLAEPYINSGSLYLCCAVFLALGLERNDRFWSASDRDWTARKVWKGEKATRDQAIPD